MANGYRIRCKLLSPLAQIDKTDKDKTLGTNIIRIKSITFADYDSDYAPSNPEGEQMPMLVRIPIYTANGFRGLLRRKAAKIIAQKAIDKGLTLSRKDFHLMFSGGGNNYATVPSISLQHKIRELNPLASLFGTSLALESKLIISDLVPVHRMTKHLSDNDYLFSQLIGKTTLITRDDILLGTKYSRFVSANDIEEWIEHNQEQIKQRKQDRMDNVKNDEKTKKDTIKNIIAKEYIIPGTILEASISFKSEPTPIERGLLLSALIEAASEQLGSSISNGFGYTEYTVTENENIVMESFRRKDFLPACNVNYDKDNEYLVAFRKWLDNLKQENISIDALLSAKKAS